MPESSESEPESASGSKFGPNPLAHAGTTAPFFPIASENLPKLLMEGCADFLAAAPAAAAAVRVAPLRVGLLSLAALHLWARLAAGLADSSGCRSCFRGLRVVSAGSFNMGTGLDAGLKGPSTIESLWGLSSAGKRADDWGACSLKSTAAGTLAGGGDGAVGLEEI